MVADPNGVGMPRIALVYGDALRAAHVREAVARHTQIVYAASAEEFDSARLDHAEVAAALVNVDGGDWLDEIEAQLETAGVSVIFNDPDISERLEGWELARWLRHLVAKLAGSGDFDPPRPATASATRGAGAASRPSAVATVPDVMAAGMGPTPVAACTLPLRARFGPEIAVSESTRSSAPVLVSAVAVGTGPTPVPLGGQAGSAPSAAPARPMHACFGPEIAVSETTRSSLPILVWAAVGSEPGASTLPVTTPSSEPRAAAGAAVSERPLSPQEIETMTADFVAVPEPGTLAAPQADNATVPPDAGAENPIPLEARGEGAVTLPSDSGSDIGTRDNLPALEDWALVDPDAAPAPVAGPKPVDERQPAGAALLDRFEGLELLPMEAMAPVVPESDPIERWLDEPAVRSGRQGQADKA